jgi:hypothetical protein
MAGVAGVLPARRGRSGFASRRRRGRWARRRCRVRSGTVKAVKYDGENDCTDDRNQCERTGAHAPDAQLQHRVRLFLHLDRQFGREYFLVSRAVIRLTGITDAIVAIGCIIGCIYHSPRSLALTVSSTTIRAARAGSLQIQSASSGARKDAQFVPLKADRRAGAAHINEGLTGQELTGTIPPKSECFLNFHSSRLLKLGFSPVIASRAASGGALVGRR